MNDTTIGTRIRQARKYLKLSARELGEALGMTEGWKNVYHWENGVSDVPDVYYTEFMKLGINPTWILTGSGLPYADNQAGLDLMKKLGHTTFPPSVVAGAQLPTASEATASALSAYIKDQASVEQKLTVFEHAIAGIGKTQKEHGVTLVQHTEMLVYHEEKINDHDIRIAKLELDLSN